MQGGLYIGRAADVGLVHEAMKKKRLRPTRSYEMTLRFHTMSKRYLDLVKGRVSRRWFVASGQVFGVL